VGTGAVASVSEARSLIDRSFPTEAFEPRENTAWDDAYGRFLALRE
jgi:rhamnulokinase